MKNVFQKSKKTEEVKKVMGINYFDDLDLINQHVHKYQSSDGLES